MSFLPYEYVTVLLSIKLLYFTFSTNLELSYRALFYICFIKGIFELRSVVGFIRLSLKMYFLPYENVPILLSNNIHIIFHWFRTKPWPGFLYISYTSHLWTTIRCRYCSTLVSYIIQIYFEFSISWRSPWLQFGFLQSLKSDYDFSENYNLEAY